MRCGEEKLALLHFLAAQGEGVMVSRKALARHFPAELDRTLDLLTRREFDRTRR